MKHYLYPKLLHIACLAGIFAAATVTNAFAAVPEPDKAIAEALSDPLLNAMKQELDRERELLLLPGMQKPYFIEYRLDDFQTYDARSQLRRADDRGSQPPAHRAGHGAVGDYTSDSSSSRGDGVGCAGARG